MKKGEVRTFVRDGKEHLVMHGVADMRYLYGKTEFSGRLLPDDDDRAGHNLIASYAMAFREYPDVMA